MAGSGVVLVVVGLGQTMKQAQACPRLSNILIPHMYDRTDIGNLWEVDSDRLHTRGYLR